MPTQIIECMAFRFPQAKQQDKSGQPMIALVIDHAPAVSYLLSMVDSVPSHLIALEGDALAEFGEAVSGLRIAVNRWNQGEKNYELVFIQGRQRQNPLTLLRKHLAALRDEAPEPGTNELLFITDPDFRASLRGDLGSIDRLVANGEWKAGTVLGGSVVEALLLHALRDYEQKNSQQFQKAIQGLHTSGSLQKKPSSNLEDWVLHELTEVAATTGLIKPDTAAQCNIARNFRNLIHPGRAARLAQECNRGTALSALAAVEHVIADLTP